MNSFFNLPNFIFNTFNTFNTFDNIDLDRENEYIFLWYKLINMFECLVFVSRYINGIQISILYML